MTQILKQAEQIANAVKPPPQIVYVNIDGSPRAISNNITVDGKQYRVVGSSKNGQEILIKRI